MVGINFNVLLRVSSVNICDLPVEKVEYEKTQTRLNDFQTHFFHIPFFIRTVTYLCVSLLSLQTIRDVPDNVQLRKDSDIDLVSVLESLAPEEGVAEASLKSNSEGIERFRRRADPRDESTAHASTGVDQGPGNPVQESLASVLNDGPPSGDGEYDSGNGVSSASSKRSDLEGDTSSGMSEVSGSSEEVASGEDQDEEKSQESATQQTVQPSIPASSDENSSNLAAQAATGSEASSVAPSIHASAEGARADEQTHTAEVTPAGAGDDSSGSGLTADEVAFISGLHRAQEVEDNSAQKRVLVKLPGSDGEDEGVSEDIENDTSDQSADSEEEASGSAEEDENAEAESAHTEDQHKDAAIIDVTSGSGLNFVSGLGEEDEALPGSVGSENDIEPQEAHKESATSGSGEFPTANTNPQATSAASSDQQYSTQPQGVQGAASPAGMPQQSEVSGSGEQSTEESQEQVDQASSQAQDQVVKTPVMASGSGEAPAKSFLSGSGESDTAEQLPGSVGGKLEEKDVSSSPNAAVRENNEAQATSESPTIVTPAESEEASGSATSLDAASGSGSSLEDLALASTHEESLPGSIGAVGPNLMTMASHEDSAAAPTLGNSKEDVQSSASGSGESNLETESSGGSVTGTKKSLTSGEETQASAVTSGDGETTDFSSGEDASGGDSSGEASGSPSKDSVLISSTENDEKLPGGLGYQDLEIPTSSGVQSASGLDESLISGSGSDSEDATLEDILTSNSGSGMAESQELDLGSSADSGSASLVVSSEKTVAENAVKKTSLPRAPHVLSGSGLPSGSGVEYSITAAKPENKQSAQLPVAQQNADGFSSGSGEEHIESSDLSASGNVQDGTKAASEMPEVQDSASGSSEQPESLPGSSGTSDILDGNSNIQEVSSARSGIQETSSGTSAPQKTLAEDLEIRHASGIF